MSKCFLVAFLLVFQAGCCRAQTAVENLGELKLIVDVDTVLIIFISESEGVNISNRFTVDDGAGLGNLHFIIRDDKNRAYPLVAHVRASVPDNMNFSVLESGGLVGQGFHMDYLKRLFGLKSGCYFVSAKYSAAIYVDSNNFNYPYLSNEVKLCI